MSDQGHTPYILMLEDDSEDRYITQTFFSERGYKIGLEFLTYPDQVIPYLADCEAKHKRLPSLILLDKNVPRGDGLEVLQQLKAHPAFKAIPVIVISGTGYKEDIDDCYKYGASSFIVKPDTDALTAKKIETFVSYWFEVTDIPNWTKRVAV